MNILVLNAGSSSLKFRLFQIKGLRPLDGLEDIVIGGKVERIGTLDSSCTFFTDTKKTENQKNIAARSVSAATRQIILLITEHLKTLSSPMKIDVVGHRIVHGGARFFKPTLIDDLAFKELAELNQLAPLHNPAGLAGIEAIHELLPSVPNVAVFDTAFHHDLPEVTARYALPSELSNQMQLRRYGFHGISYRYVSDRLQLLLGNNGSKEPESARMIICHLGNGASVCALLNGKSIDTSMGFTPSEGLIMGTRSGDIDPGLLLYLQSSKQITADRISELVNQQSGLLGISGLSADVRDLEKAAVQGNQAALLALESFAYRVRKYIGSYAAALGGVDTLVFTGGIGQYSALMRMRICEGLGFLGIALNSQVNQKAIGNDITDISLKKNQKVWVIPTDEERQIAREVYEQVGDTCVQN